MAKQERAAGSSDRPNDNSRRSLEAHAYVFTASFCLMVIEIVAGRIIAPYLGNSLYTWTSVIGVVLTGITLGNYVGGTVAERGVSWRGVGLLFGFAGFAAALSYYVYVPTYEAVKAFVMPMPMATFFFAFIGFFPLSFLLSMVTPIVITRSLKSLEKTGTTVGRIYAVSALASIVGTFAAGFVLIPLLGVKTIVLSVSAILLLAGVLASRGGAVAELPVKMAVLLLWCSFLSGPMCQMETAYYCISLERAESDRGVGVRLVLDRLTHSFVYEDPTVLEYNYENVYATALEYVSLGLDGRRPIRTLSLGGGGYTMPRYIEANYEDALIDVVEIDPMVTEANVKLFGLNPYGDINTFNEDARMFFERGAEGGRYDIVFGDAFNDYSVPYHLTTSEFTQMVRDRLAPGGIYALNTIDDYDHGRLLASFLRTLGDVFPHVELAPITKDWRTTGRNTFVILASDSPIERDDWVLAAESAVAERIAPPASMSPEDIAYLVPQSEMAQLVRERRGVLLTDNYAPVDNMTAPLFRRK